MELTAEEANRERIEDIGFNQNLDVQIKKNNLVPTTILSKAIEQIEQMGNWKVLVAIANAKDYKDSKPKDECLYTFCDIESEKLREVIYKRIEDESK